MNIIASPNQLRVIGEANLSDARQLHIELLAFLDPTSTEQELDLTELTHFDTSALQVFIAAVHYQPHLVVRISSAIQPMLERSGALAHFNCAVSCPLPQA